MACTEKEKKELEDKIFNEHPEYGRDIIEKAVSLCCAENDNIRNIEECAVERTKMIYLMTFNK